MRLPAQGNAFVRRSGRPCAPYAAATMQGNVQSMFRCQRNGDMHPGSAEDLETNEYAILADPDLQRHFLRRPAVSAGQRPVADFRRDAHRQSFAWLLLPARRLCRALGDLDDRLLAAGAAGRGARHRGGGAADGARLPAASGLRSAAAGAADGRLRLPVPAGGARHLDRQQLRHQPARRADQERRDRRASICRSTACS